MDDSDATERIDPERAAARSRDAELIGRIRAGDADAFGQLYDLWFDRVFDLVARVVRNQDIAAEVAQDTFLSAWRKLDTLENPDAFGGWLLRIARNAAYNRSEREGRSRAVDDQELAVIESVGAGASNAPSGFGVEDRLGRASRPSMVIEDREVVDLLWQAAAALPARDLEVLDLQLRHGLSPAEIGAVLGMNRNAANQLVHRVRGRLETAIRARVLWRAGEPVCEVLSQRLEQAGVTSFGPEAVKVIERHVPGCNECDERQRTRLAPAAMFAALPLMVVPAFLKAHAAITLQGAGVPMAGSTFASGGLGSAVGGSLAGSAPTPASQVASTFAPPKTSLGTEVGDALSHQPIVLHDAPIVLHPAPIVLAPPTPTAQTVAKGSSWLIPAGVAATVIVLAMLFGGGLWWGNHNQETLASGGGPASLNGSVGATSTTGVPFVAPGSIPGGTTETSVPSTEPVNGETTTTTGGVVSPPESTPSSTTINGKPTPPPPPPPPTSPTTQATTNSTTSTTQPSTTTTTTKPTFRISFSMNPAAPNFYGCTYNPSNPDCTYPLASAASVPPTLSWSVSPKGGTVTVTGSDGSFANTAARNNVAISTTRTGSYAVCPGGYRDTGKNYCVGAKYSQATPYTYTLTVTAPDGTVWETRTVQLVLQAPIG